MVANITGNKQLLGQNRKHKLRALKRAQYQSYKDDCYHKKQNLWSGSKSVILTAIVCSQMLPALPSLATTEQTFQDFDRYCASCHVKGGNILGGATLKKKDLIRNNALDAIELEKLIGYGKGRMRGYSEKCPSQETCSFGIKLTDEQISGIAQLVLEQAELGWPDR